MKLKWLVGKIFQTSFSWSLQRRCPLESQRNSYSERPLKIDDSFFQAKVTLRAVWESNEYGDIDFRKCKLRIFWKFKFLRNYSGSFFVEGTQVK